MFLPISTTKKCLKGTLFFYRVSWCDLSRANRMHKYGTIQLQGIRLGYYLQSQAYSIFFLRT